MDVTGKPLGDCRSFSVPFILVSVVFFSLYLFLLSIMLGDFTKVYFFRGSLFFTLVLVVSFAGSILLAQEMKKRSLYWQTALPLVIVTALLPVLYVIFTFHDPLNPATKYLANAFVAQIMGYAVLPACAACLLRGWKKTGCSLSDGEIFLSSAAAILGLAFLVCLLWYTATYVPPPPRQSYFLNFTNTEWYLGLFGLFYGALVLPLLGLLFLARGIEYRKLPPIHADDNITI